MFVRAGLVSGGWWVLAAADEEEGLMICPSFEVRANGASVSTSSASTTAAERSEDLETYIATMSQILDKK